jgi:hypothetical protein
MKEVINMTFKTLVKRFNNLGITIEYKMGIDGKGYYIDENCATTSREAVEEILRQMEEERKRLEKDN